MTTDYCAIWKLATALDVSVMTTACTGTSARFTTTFPSFVSQIIISPVVLAGAPNVVRRVRARALHVLSV